MGENSSAENIIRELKAENERLKKESDLKTGWISLISHDFKEAFSSTLLLIEALENKTISEADFFTLLPQVKQDARKNLQTITDTGTWIKTQSDGFAPQMSEFFAVELFAQLRQNFQKKLQEKQLQFLFEGDENTAINTDRFLIFYILKKIVDNAIKYSHHKDPICFKIKSSQDWAVLSIVDQGVGMDKKQSKNIFSFNSAVFRGTEGEIGAGLSLKIVKNFVSLVHGKMEVHSAENGGTTVSVFLPRIKK
jgi:K+-sensing histidine kinase KdpD